MALSRFELPLDRTDLQGRRLPYGANNFLCSRTHHKLSIMVLRNFLKPVLCAGPCGAVATDGAQQV